MKNANNKIDRYIRAVGNKLNLPKEIKTRVMEDFISSIQGRREAGQNDEEIMAELGSAKKAAAELNEQMKEYTYIKSPWRWLCLGLVILCIAYLAFGGTTNLLLYLFNKSLNHDIGIIGGADGPTAIFITTSPNVVPYAFRRAIPAIILLIMSLLGFFRLRKCPRK